ncbi:post-GPI attachment to proteins factor 2-like isoform X1 [Haliotis cracherodii]|uniref:post-GPI attachment to proteins factor 2-like isoform X1 n=1 Tax=Haliotis cracherodii TaxID=6455 RepID=UPI0039EA59DD
MPASYSDLNKPVHFKLTLATLGKIVCSLPIFATFFCVIWSVIFDFKSSTKTHCGVPNFLPSISAAIGGFTPQRYVWRVCIALHCAPRFMVAIAYYSYHTSIHVGLRNQLYKTLAALCTFLHICENMALIGLTYVSSTENHDLHERFFILFMLCSLTYMLLTTYVFSWGRSANGRSISHTEMKSLRHKATLFLFNISVFMFAVYLFFRHNAYCEPGAYSWFALCEYLIVLSNVCFHGTMILDFNTYSVAMVDMEPSAAHTTYLTV